LKNDEIIARVAINIYGEEKVNELIQSGKDIPVHTLMGWKQIDPAYRVKKGEHGIEVRLWKKRKTDEKNNNEISEESGDDFYKVRSFLFTLEQIEKGEDVE